MKRLIYLSTFTLFSLVLFISYDLSSRSGGAPVDNGNAGFSGGRFENGRTCATSGCHDGNATATSGLISTNIDSNGYVPGQSYQITVTASKNGMSKTGFQLSVQDLSGSFAGTLQSGSNHMQVNGGYITHTTMGTASMGGSRSWTLDWTAPPPGSGEVEISVAINLSNNDGTSSGDEIVTELITVAEGTSTGIEDPLASGISIRYMSSSRQIRLIPSEQLTGQSSFSIFNLAGQEVMNGVLNLDGEETLSLQELATGYYIFTLNEIPGAVAQFVQQ